MAFDLDMIKKVYDRYSSRVAAARKATGRHLTLTEKILYAHLSAGDATQAFGRGVDYVDFAPDRVAMQDATAQMALLQFMTCGRPACINCSKAICAVASCIATRSGAKST